MRTPPRDDTLAIRNRIKLLSHIAIRADAIHGKSATTWLEVGRLVSAAIVAHGLEDVPSRTTRRPPLFELDIWMNYFEQSRAQEFEPLNDATPTHANPGSLEKIRVMTERFSSGQPLHHENDETFISKLDRKRLGFGS